MAANVKSTNTYPVLLSGVRPDSVAAVRMVLGSKCNGGGKIVSFNHNKTTGQSIIVFEDNKVAEELVKKVLQLNVMTISYLSETLTKDPAFSEEIKRTINQPQIISQPNRELNILLMGETGVGKSTWINSFANYLTYSTLGEAKKKNLISLIPTKFTMNNKLSYDKSIVISTGSDANENETAGESATQFPKTYLFPLSDGVVLRLIDTPGIGDTRGYDQDQKNFRNTLKHIKHLNALHGIFILLKPNDSKLTVTFKFCIKELLAGLHKDAGRNVVFCFTNCRGTFYVPGDTLVALRKLLTDKGVDIALNKESIYSFDNEAFRYLAAVKSIKPVEFTEEEERLYSGSWEKAVGETERLMLHVASRQPHLVKKMLIINDARHRPVARPI